jgi:hypothetical protein
MTAEELAAVLTAHGYRYEHEDDLQAGIEQVLAGADIPFEREVEIGRRDRIDFLAGRVGIEVKIKCGLSDMTRQLHRYAQSDLVDALLLVTPSMRLRSLVPRRLNNKPVVVAWIGGVL